MMEVACDYDQNEEIKSGVTILLKINSEMEESCDGSILSMNIPVNVY